MKITVSDNKGALTDMILRAGVVAQPPRSLRTRATKIGESIPVKATVTWESLDNEVKLGLKKAGQVETVPSPQWATQSGSAAFEMDTSGNVTFKQGGTGRVVLVWDFLDSAKQLKKAYLPGQFAVADAAGKTTSTALAVASSSNVKPIAQVAAKKTNWWLIGGGLALVGAGVAAWKFWPRKGRRR